MPNSIRRFPNNNLVSPVAVSDRLKIPDSLVRAALLELLSKGLVVKLVSSTELK